MNKRIVFQDSDLGRSNMATLWDAIVLGASRGEARPKDKIRLEAKIQRKLLAATDPAPVEDQQTRPPKARVLKGCDQVVMFEPAEMELIDSYIGKVPWGGNQSMAVADLYDLLGVAPDAQETD